MDSAGSLGGVLDILVRSRPRGRLHRPIWVGEPHSQVGRSALLYDVAIAVLANLTGVVRPCAAGVALDFDECLPPGDALTCKPQVFTFRLVLLPLCVHVADTEPEVDKNVPGCSSQAIAVGPEGTSDPPIGLYLLQRPVSSEADLVRYSNARSQIQSTKFDLPRPSLRGCTNPKVGSNELAPVVPD